MCRFSCLVILLRSACSLRHPAAAPRSPTSINPFSPSSSHPAILSRTRSLDPLPAQGREEDRRDNQRERKRAKGYLQGTSGTFPRLPSAAPHLPVRRVATTGVKRQLSIVDCHFLFTRAFHSTLLLSRRRTSSLCLLLVFSAASSSSSSLLLLSSFLPFLLLLPFSALRPFFIFIYALSCPSPSGTIRYSTSTSTLGRACSPSSGGPPTNLTPTTSQPRAHPHCTLAVHTTHTLPPSGHLRPTFHLVRPNSRATFHPLSSSSFAPTITTTTTTTTTTVLQPASPQPSPVRGFVLARFFAALLAPAIRRMRPLSSYLFLTL